MLGAIIDESEMPGVSCIVPFSLTNGEESEAYRCAIQEYVAGESVTMNVMTRSMVRKEEELDKCEENVSVGDLWSVVTPESGSDSVPETALRVSSQPEPLMMPEVGSKVGKGHGADEAEVSPMPDEPQAKTSEMDECEVSGEGSPTPLDKSLPVSNDDAELCKLAGEIGPVREGSDGDRFREELMSDRSLKDWRELGERCERGFKWKKNVLVRSMYVTWEQFRDVLVLPESYRVKVLELGHVRNGHLGAEKVSAMISRYFVWPGMAKDIVTHCGSCRVCQVRSKHKPRRAPVVERPILTEPFKSIAIDLVGPLPKGKGGCQYLLTYVCLATRWPEAVPLRGITAKAVCDGLWSIFSRTSIPEVILSDQGSQFCGKVVKQLCEMLGIEKIRTSPYHPERNGTVERMHGTFKAILGKCISDKVDWVSQILFFLYCGRCHILILGSAHLI